MAMFNARLEFNVMNEFAELGMLLVQSVQGNLNSYVKLGEMSCI